MAKILIVDDRITNRELLLTLLGYVGHQLLEATDGEEGLAITRAEHPDLIITDIMMPKMDGYEFAHQVRADDSIKDTQIIFYTSSYIVAETLRLANACGVSIVVGKPIEPESFLKKVNEALATKHTPASITVSEEFHREHMRVLTDTLVNKVELLEAEVIERQRAEEKLRQSAANQLGLIDSTNDHMWSVDAQYRLITGNAEFLRYTEKVLGKRLLEGESILHHTIQLELRNEWRSYLDRAIKGERFVVETQTHLVPPARYREFCFNPIFDINGKTTGVAISSRDITDRKKADELIHVREEQYRSLFEDSPISFWLEDFSEVKNRLDTLRESGIDDLPEYLRNHPEFLIECANLIQVLDVNTAAINLYQANNKTELLGKLGETSVPMALAQIEYELIQLAKGELNFEREGVDQTLTGNKVYVNIHWTVVPGFEHDLSRVIVSAVNVTEQKQAEKRIHHQLQRLSALRSIDLAISNTFDMKLSLRVLLNVTISQLGVDAVSVLLLNRALTRLEYAAGEGFDTSTIQRTNLRIGEGHAGLAALERKSIHVKNLAEIDNKLIVNELFKEEKFVFYYALPLIAKGELKGILEIFHRTELDPDQEWLDFLETLAGQAAIAIDNAQLFEGMQRSNLELSLAYDATIEGWSAALDLRDKETEGHSQRVTDLTIRLAQSMGVSESDLIQIRRGALLHDIGKLGIPDHILLKTDKLTNEEWEIMRKHPVYAYDMLSSISYLKSALDIPYCHHEKWDGTGYPRGLKNENIPLAARIFAIVDVWDALTSNRPYRPAWTQEQTIKHIKEQSGTHFDPKVVEAFFNMINH